MITRYNRLKIGMDDVGSIVEPTSSLAAADVISVPSVVMSYAVILLLNDDIFIENQDFLPPVPINAILTLSNYILYAVPSTYYLIRHKSLMPSLISKIFSRSTQAVSYKHPMFNGQLLADVYSNHLSHKLHAQKKTLCDEEDINVLSASFQFFAIFS